MSILIKGIKMPKEGAERCIVIGGDGTIRTFTGAMIDYATAVPVPTHGDLVDRDKMFIEFVVEGQKTTRYKVGEKWELNGEEIRRVIQRLPTIIPAEEE